MNTTPPLIHPPLHATNKRGTETRQPYRRPAPRRPTWSEVAHTFAPLVFAPWFYGPPVIVLLGPWLLLVLLLIPPVAFLITLALVCVVTAGILTTLAAIVASPYLLVRHLRTRHLSWRHQFAVGPDLPGAAPSVDAPVPPEPRSRWIPAPAVSASSHRA
jgi:hypothetical protein